MAKSTAPQVARSYLAQLEKALADLSSEVRGEIMAGIREELDGLDASAAAARIESLGDPEFIATEARTEARGATALTSRTSRQPTWYSVLTDALIIVGGYIVPVIGWLVGVAMLWASDRWNSRDKWLGTLVGPAVIAVGLLITVGVTLLVRSGSTGNLMWWHIALLCTLVLPLIANVIVGIRLLRR